MYLHDGTWAIEKGMDLAEIETIHQYQGPAEKAATESRIISTIVLGDFFYQLRETTRRWRGVHCFENGTFTRRGKKLLQAQTKMRWSKTGQSLIATNPRRSWRAPCAEVQAMYRDETDAEIKNGSLICRAWGYFSIFI